MRTSYGEVSLRSRRHAFRDRLSIGGSLIVDGGMHGPNQSELSSLSSLRGATMTRRVRLTSSCIGPKYRFVPKLHSRFPMGQFSIAVMYRCTSASTLGPNDGNRSRSAK